MYVCMYTHIRINTYIYIYMYAARSPIREGGWGPVASTACDLQHMASLCPRSCRCAIIGVPWCLRRLSTSSARLKQRLEDKITPG